MKQTTEVATIVCTENGVEVRRQESTVTRLEYTRDELAAMVLHHEQTNPVSLGALEECEFMEGASPSSRLFDEHDDTLAFVFVETKSEVG